MIAYIVKCCGCTDCFSWAAFKDEQFAVNFAMEHCNNPEGYIIEKATDLEYFKELWEEE